MVWRKIRDAIAWASRKNLPETGFWKPGLRSRMRSETYDLVLAESYPVSLSIVRDRAGSAREVVIAAQGQTGKAEGGLPLIYEDLGVAISRAMQGRDPRTGQGTAFDRGGAA